MTQGELRQVLKLVDQNRQQGSAVVHSVEQVITVVNKTQRDVVVNRRQLNKLTTHLNDLTDLLTERIQGQLEAHEQCIHALELDMQINTLLTIASELFMLQFSYTFCLRV